MTATPTTVQAYGRMAVRLSQCRKRAFKRAQTRALRHGSTVYRGQVHDLGSLSMQYVHRPQPRRQKATEPSASAIQCITWNCGGLHQLRFQELPVWLEQLRTQNTATVVCVQETHWPTDSEFSHDHWHFIHMGVLFAVSKVVAPQSSLRFAAVVPGRLLHLRIEGSPAIDFLGVYQFSWNLHRASVPGGAAQQTAHTLRQRSLVWDAIRTWTRRVPQRNWLLILGDLNCTLRPQHPHVGPGVAFHSHDPHQDQAEFQGMVQSLNLVALNTWRRGGSLPPARSYS